MNEELLKAISDMMDEKLKINQQETNEKLKAMSDMMDEKLKANQQETHLMINAVVDEMGKMEARIRKEMNERFSKVDEQLLSMQHDINACKLEKETLDILIRKIDQLEQRIERIEKKSA